MNFCLRECKIIPLIHRRIINALVIKIPYTKISAYEVNPYAMFNVQSLPNIPRKIKMAITPNDPSVTPFPTPK